MIYCNSNSEAWLQISNTSVEENVYPLQKSIYKVSWNEDQVKILTLQRLMLSFYQARIIYIRQVTQLNDAKKTAGIDSKLALTNAERFELEKKLSQEAKRW